MERKLIKAISLFLAVCLLAGCAPAANTPSSEPPTEEIAGSPTPEIVEMTEEELHKEFQRVFDSCGSVLSPTEEQLAAEQTLLEDFAANAQGVPENYQALYEEWRANLVSALIGAVQAECKQLVADRALYLGTHDGLCYADYIDLEGDGRPEFVTIGIDQSSTALTIANVSIYTNVDGHMELYCSGRFSMGGAIAWGLSLSDNGGQAYLHLSMTFGGDKSEQRDIFYYMENGKFEVNDRLFHYATKSTGEQEYASTDDGDLTEEAYNAVFQGYTETQQLVNYSDGQGISTTRGILPDAAEFWAVKDTQLQEIIGGRSFYERGNPGLVYANYFDSEQDGKLELLILSWSTNSDYDQIITLELYAGEDGQMVKCWSNDLTFSSLDDSAKVSLVMRDGKTYLRFSTNSFNASLWDIESNDFYAIDRSGGVAEKLSYNYDAMAEQEKYSDNGASIGAEDYRARLDSYATREKIIDLGRLYNGEYPTVHAVGLFDSKDEPNGSASEQIYEAALNGDFSYFEGSYSPNVDYPGFDNVWLDKSGIVTGGEGYYAETAPISITRGEGGSLICVVTREDRIGSGDGSSPYDYCGEFYEILPDWNTGTVLLNYVVIDGGVGGGTYIKK